MYVCISVMCAFMSCTLRLHVRFHVLYATCAPTPWCHACALCMYVHVYMYVYIYTHTHIHTYTLTHTLTHTHARTHTHTHTHEEHTYTCDRHMIQHDSSQRTRLQQSSIFTILTLEFLSLFVQRNYRTRISRAAWERTTAQSAGCNSWCMRLTLRISKVDSRGKGKSQKTQQYHGKETYACLYSRFCVCSSTSQSAGHKTLMIIHGLGVDFFKDML